MTDPAAAVHRYTVVAIHEDGRHTTENDRVYARTIAGAITAVLTDPQMRYILDRPGEPGDTSFTLVVARHGDS